MMKIARSIVSLAFVATAFAACKSPMEIEVINREMMATSTISEVSLVYPFDETVSEETYIIRSGPIADPAQVIPGTSITASGAIHQDEGGKTISLSIDLLYPDHMLYVDPFPSDAERTIGFRLDIQDMPVTPDTVGPEEGFVYNDPANVEAKLYIRSESGRSDSISATQAIRFVEIVDKVTGRKEIVGIIMLAALRGNLIVGSSRLNQLFGVITVPYTTLEG